MSAATRPSQITLPANSLRPFNAQRDLEAVADLIELGFNDTLDDSGISMSPWVDSSRGRSSRRTWIAAGADRPLQGQPVHAESFHGEDGLGGANIQADDPGEWAEIFSGPADELINQMAHRHPLEITLIAVCPLTNLALALQRDAEGMGYLKEVMIMGGAVRTKGNITPQAGFNFYVDPLAAKRVLESGLPMTLVPLDATHQVSLTADLMEGRVRPLQNSFSRLVIDATGYDSKAGLFRGGRRETYLHDPLAVGAVIIPNWSEKKTYPSLL